MVPLTSCKSGTLVVTPFWSLPAFNKNGDIIKGLYAVGEMIGGLWYNNYPSGSGMMAGAVFGKRAGTHASANTN